MSRTCIGFAGLTAIVAAAEVVGGAPAFLTANTILGVAAILLLRLPRGLESRR